MHRHMDEMACEMELLVFCELHSSGREPLAGSVLRPVA